MVALKFIAIILLSYLLGAIPFGIIATKLTRGIDIRDYGSGKIGATNVLRSAGGKAGLLTLIPDVAKGAVSVMIAWLVLDGYAAQIVAALAAMVGHNWPIYANFRGGRGVGPYVGGMAAMYWPVALACGPGVGLGVAALTRYASLGSIFVVLSSFTAMLLMVLLGMQPTEYLIYAGVGGGLILFQHRDNIQRLAAGTERKLGEKAEKRGNLLPKYIKE
jgi:glycerol-3-phosphate acyltransferase PlsY